MYRYYDCQKQDFFPFEGGMAELFEHLARGNSVKIGAIGMASFSSPLAMSEYTANVRLPVEVDVVVMQFDVVIAQEKTQSLGRLFNLFHTYEYHKVVLIRDMHAFVLLPVQHRNWRELYRQFAELFRAPIFTKR